MNNWAEFAPLPLLYSTVWCEGAKVRRFLIHEQKEILKGLSHKKRMQNYTFYPYYYLCTVFLLRSFIDLISMFMTQFLHMC